MNLLVGFMGDGSGCRSAHSGVSRRFSSVVEGLLIELLEHVGSH